MKAFAETNIGIKRSSNQDYVFETLKSVGKLPNLFIVADGMGGHKAGEIASKSAVEAAVKKIKSSKEKDPFSIMQEAVEKANEAVVEKAVKDEGCEGMGTTMVMATITEKAVYIANVGDSRLYFIDDEIHQITRDHSYVEEMVSLGEIPKEEARNHEKKNIITRAIGVEQEILADYFEVQYKKGDYILMCSDGLTNMIEDDKIKEIVLSNTSVDDKTHALINAANENGGKDNISVVIVEI
ncbi:MAG: Stp1/IreP family PP2C-type Ser/Thr phosphatase [Lachnospiraceae bacterium]|nr:Stp1/IreP family PP2C-type Ser/Thr phosphatase [Lachnospiraceae bacterium]